MSLLLPLVAETLFLSIVFTPAVPQPTAAKTRLELGERGIEIRYRPMAWDDELATRMRTASTQERMSLELLTVKSRWAASLESAFRFRIGSKEFDAGTYALTFWIDANGALEAVILQGRTRHVVKASCSRAKKAEFTACSLMAGAGGRVSWEMRYGEIRGELPIQLLGDK